MSLLQCNVSCGDTIKSLWKGPEGFQESLVNLAKLRFGVLQSRGDGEHKLGSRSRASQALQNSTEGHVTVTTEPRRISAPNSSDKSTFRIAVLRGVIDTVLVREAHVKAWPCNISGSSLTFMSVIFIH